MAYYDSSQFMREATPEVIANYQRTILVDDTLEGGSGFLFVAEGSSTERWFNGEYRMVHQERVLAIKNGKAFTLPDFNVFRGNGRSPKWETVNAIKNNGVLDKVVAAFEAHIPAGAVAPVAVEVEDQEPSSPVGSALETLFAGAIAEASAEKMFDIIHDKLDTYIAAEYGALPKRLELVSNDKVRPIEGLFHARFDEVLQFVAAGIPVFLTGHAGTGKSHLAEQVAEALGVGFHFTNAVHDVYTMKGFIDASGNYQETEFYRFCRDGGIFFFDEFDSSVAEAIVWVHAALANGYAEFPTGRVTLHSDCRFIAGGNTAGTGADNRYTARSALDGATLNRFALIDIDYDPAIETAVSRGNAHIVEFARSFRRACDKVGVDHIVSPRNIDFAARVWGVLDPVTVLKTVFTKQLIQDDLAVVVNEMNDLTDDNPLFGALLLRVKNGD